MRPSPNPTSASSAPGRRPRLAWCLSGLLVLAGLALVPGLRARPQSAAPADAPAPKASALPVTGLPVVSRPPASQPVVGLPEDAHLDTTPPRKTKGLDLVRMGWTYNCMECHKLLTSRWHYDRPMAEHRDLVLEHGNNRFCLNCHHATNRNAFVDYDGAEIAQADVVQLCAKCHGPIYRDWEAGVHGRSNGYWKADAGPRTKLRCIQCHDPHRPKFPSMTPLPPLRYPPRAAHPPTEAAAAPAGHP